ncbi:hypothetical protein [Sphingomonas sp. PP-CC-3G-468]|uniref:hypothetical protein n=1 Tax=Sphingomonas sp. PP-CC-3G-468 TaxID=2135656 RepID=UPI00104D5D88|nr:hypothetical protein [Sphingomonas sp. PP-CC-3G-468]TCM10355.1 hypothetical protein C8J41_101870 [Sphingomonas sp. PP-CC-3G-468]
MPDTTEDISVAADEAVAEEQYAPVAWRHTESYFVDGVLGVAKAAGVHRISLGQVNFNPTPGAGKPMLTPVCSLILTPEGLDLLIEALQDAKLQGTEDD